MMPLVLLILANLLTSSAIAEDASWKGLCKRQSQVLLPFDEQVELKRCSSMDPVPLGCVNVLIKNSLAITKRYDKCMALNR